MSDIIGMTDEFMKKIKMHPEQVDIRSVTRDYMNEMDKGLSAEGSSLPMIPTYISVDGAAADNTPVIAIDAGGTNLRVALVTFRDGKPVTERLEKCSMPGSHGEISVDEFFAEIAEKVLPLTEFSGSISFCFSYPVEIFENLEGRIILLTKEVKVRDSSGVIIGESLVKKLKTLGVTRDLRVIVLNDTAAGLMGGLANLDISHGDGFAGLILGTGFNCCYVEKQGKISKISSNKSMIINCESGHFGLAPYGLADDVLDTESDYPGVARFEKMMSGVYLGQLISNTAKFAAKEGLLSAEFATDGGQFTTPEYDRFLRGDNNKVKNLCKGSDAQVLTALIDMCFERVARLVCATISALCLHCDGGKTAEHPFTVVAEGSLFHNSLLFREKLDQYLNKHTKGVLGRYVSIAHAENATMAGSALAALIN